MADSFLLSQPFVDKLRSTVERVDGTPLPGAGGTKRGPILEDPGGQSSGKVFRIATFDGSWAKGSTKTVTFQDVAPGGSLTPSSTTVTATNLFMDLGSANTTASPCAIAKAGPSWFLVEAESQAEAEAEAECKEVVTKVEPASSLTLVNSVSVGNAKVLTGISGNVVTNVACVDGNLTVTTVPLACLAINSNLSGLVSVSDTTLALSDLATVTTQTLTLPAQRGCS